MRKANVENNINKYYVIIGSILILIAAVIIMLSISKNTNQYLVQMGTVEYTEITTGYILKKEKTIEKDQSKVLVPIIAEGSRVSKNDIIATYKGNEYKNYEETLATMDKEILERMKDLPVVYSSEVDTIEDTIYYLIKQSIGETSYNKMQEYKQKINSNINKRANIIGELSPDGAEIKRLIEQRNQYEADAKKSNDNILATMPGIVSYTVDGLEEVLNFENLEYNKIVSEINSKHNVDNTKIKIVGNYEAYIVFKASLDNIQYIKKGNKYRLRLIEENNYELLATLEKTNKVDDGIEVYFRVTNGIENLIDLREIELEVVWDYEHGLVVPVNALQEYENIQASYITAIKKSEYKNIPVIIQVKNKSFAVVKNYEEEQLEELGITSEYELELYDRMIVGTKN